LILHAGIVYFVIALQNELRDGDDFITLREKLLNNAWQRLRRVLCGVVEQYDRPRNHVFHYPICDLLSVNAFPIEAVIIGFVAPAIVPNRVVVMKKLSNFA